MLLSIHNKAKGSNISLQGSQKELAHMRKYGNVSVQANTFRNADTQVSA